jgi:peptide deformylase
MIQPYERLLHELIQFWINDWLMNPHHIEETEHLFDDALLMVKSLPFGTLEIESELSIDNLDLAESLSYFMFEVMKHSNGIGLSAIQIGCPLRIFVMNVNGEKTCINPSWQPLSKKMISMSEGCLSFPKEHCIVSRPDMIDVEYYDIVGNKVKETLTGLEARCFIHECDHLDGITMHMKQSKLKRDIYLRKLSKKKPSFSWM